MPEDTTFALPEPTVPEAAALSRLIGRDAAFALIEADGGARVAIPKSVNQGSALAQKIGLDAARILSREYGGTMLKVPLGKPWLAIVYRVRDRLSYGAIARRLRTTEGRVWCWLEERGATARAPGTDQPAAPLNPKKAP